MMRPLPLALVLMVAPSLLGQDAPPAVPALEEAGVILTQLVNGGFIVVGDLNEARAVIDAWPGSAQEISSQALRALRSEPDAAWFIATEKAREWHARYRRLLDELKRA